MAESPKSKDLYLLIAGMRVQTSPPANATSGKAYWLKETTTDDRILRDSKFNGDWFSDPKAAWNSVRFQDWLIATAFGESAKNKTDFVAIAEPSLVSKDLQSKEFTREMKDLTATILKELESKDGRPRSLLNTLTVGISRHVNTAGKEVFMLGAGTRRRARFWKTESVAIQADVEFFIPFYELKNTEPTPQTQHFYSINAGIALSHSDGSAIDKDEETNKELIAVRFNFRVPFGGQWNSDGTRLENVFGTPEIKIQKKIRENPQYETSPWINFAGWQKFTEAFCESRDGRELLNVPIGPLLLEKLKDSTGVTDILTKQDRIKAVKTDLLHTYKEYKETMALLDNIWDVKSDAKDGAGPSAGQRKLGNLLESLGFMTSEPPSSGQYKYAFKLAKDLTVWDVINRIFAELDGYPLWVKGANPTKRNEYRAAISFASQRSETEAGKTHLGLAGLIYNIALKTVPAGAPAKKDEDDGAWIVVSKDNFNKDQSVFIKDDDEDEDEPNPNPAPQPAPEGQSTVEVFLHIGKWFSDETLDDNWYKRLLPLPPKPEQPRVPMPGIRFLPIKRTPGIHPTGRKEADFSWEVRGDLLSFGIDIKSATKDGLTFLKDYADRFGLGALEIRLAISILPEVNNSGKEWWEKVSIGVGVKLKDLRLSFAPKEKKEEQKEDDDDELMDGIENILSEEWLRELAPEKVQDRKPKTRLSAKKKDKFSISFGYLTQLTKDSAGTLDVQLYNAKGNRGRLAIIPIDRSLKVIYIRQVGIGLKGIENLELKGGLPDTAQLTLAITGGIRTSVFELGFIGAKLIFQLNNMTALPQFELDGLDVSIKVGPVVFSGSFFKAGIEYAGMLTVEFPKASFSAMGFYGSLCVVYVDRDDQIIAELNEGKVHSELNAKLLAKNIRAAETTPIKKGRGKDEWELYTSDNTTYTITDEDEKLNVLASQKTFFVYAMLNAASGCGPTFGPIQFTGIALGYGYNRRLIVPKIEQVARFPLVKMVMGEGGYEPVETRRDTQKEPLEDPVFMLEKMKDYVVGEAGQQFACAGVRFTVGGIIDCFALMVVQWGDRDIELSMLGLARFRHPRDVKSPAICYVEMQMLMSFKPREGTFQLQAVLTPNSWIINKDCKLTGGFALFVWFDGKHKGDWVITFGGYHPRFVRPAHYPLVPRIGLNWRVNKNLTIKGNLYLAITPSCGMLGARMEATFHSGRISAWFTAYLDAIVNWDPLFFEVDIGISLRVEADLVIHTLKVTLGVNIQLWGPPVGGIAHIDLAVISFDIPFGEKKPDKPLLVESWEKFCTNFLNLNGTDTPAVNAPVQAFPIVQPNLVAGRQNLNSIPNSRREERATKRDDDLWKVRADELELAASTVVPVTTLNVGTVQTNSPPEGVQDRSLTGQPVMVTKPLAIQKKGMLRADKPQKLSVHPMGKDLESVLNVTVVRDDVTSTAPINLTGWAMEEETSALPAALWDPAKPDLRPSEPSAKMIEGGIIGVKKLKPPRGKLGNKIDVPSIEWHQLAVFTVDRPTTSQEIPGGTGSRDLRRVMVEKQESQKEVVAALTLAGFTLTWQPAPVTNLSFRELQADPLTGAVAA